MRDDYDRFVRDATHVVVLSPADESEMGENERKAIDVMLRAMRHSTMQRLLAHVKVSTDGNTVDSVEWEAMENRVRPRDEVDVDKGREDVIDGDGDDDEMHKKSRHVGKKRIRPSDFDT